MSGTPETIIVAATAFRVAVGNEIDIFVSLQDANGLAVFGEVVSIVTDDGLTITSGGETDTSGTVALKATSDIAGTFRPVFNNADAGSKAVEVTFSEDGYRVPIGGDTGPDEPTGIANSRIRINNIRTILSNIDASQHPGISNDAVVGMQTRVDTLETSLNNYETSQSNQSGCKDSVRVTRADGTEEQMPIDEFTNQYVPPSPLDIANEVVDIIRARNTDFGDSSFDPTEFDEELNELIEEVEESLGRGWMGYSTTDELIDTYFEPFDDRLSDLEENEDEDFEEWVESSRSTSTISIEGVDIERIDTVTFDRPNGKQVKLVLNHGS